MTSRRAFPPACFFWGKRCSSCVDNCASRQAKDEDMKLQTEEKQP